MARINISFTESSRKEFESTAKQYGLNMSDFTSSLISTEIGVDSTEFGRNLMEREAAATPKEANASITLSKEQEASLGWLSRKFGMTKNNIVKMLFFKNRGKIKSKRGGALILTSRNDFILCHPQQDTINADIVETHKVYVDLVQKHYSLLSDNKELYDRKLNPISGFARIYKKTGIRVKGKGDFKKQAMINAWKIWGKNEHTRNSQALKITKGLPLPFGRMDIRPSGRGFYLRLYNGKNWHWTKLSISIGGSLPNSVISIDVNNLLEDEVRIIY